VATTLQAGYLQRPFNPSWSDLFGSPPAQPVNEAAFPSNDQTNVPNQLPTADAHNAVKMGMALFGIIVAGILTAYFLEKDNSAE